jgi:hypothetical protein
MGLLGSQASSKKTIMNFELGFSTLQGQKKSKKFFENNVASAILLLLHFFSSWIFLGFFEGCCFGYFCCLSETPFSTLLAEKWFGSSSIHH